MILWQPAQSYIISPGNKYARASHKPDRTSQTQVENRARRISLAFSGQWLGLTCSRTDLSLPDDRQGVRLAEFYQ